MKHKYGKNGLSAKSSSICLPCMGRFFILSDFSADKHFPSFFAQRPPIRIRNHEYKKTSTRRYWFKLALASHFDTKKSFRFAVGAAGCIWVQNALFGCIL